MPLAPTFEPEGTTANLAGDAVSLMDRAQALKAAEFQLQQAKIKAAIQAPIDEAKGQADLIQAGIGLEAAKRAQEQRGRAYAMKDAADTEFDSMMLVGDEDARAEMARRWAGNYAHLDNVAEFKPEMAAKKEIIAKIITEHQAFKALDMKSQDAQELARIQADEKAKAAVESNDLKVQIQQMKSDQSKATSEATAQRQQQKFESSGGVEQQKIAAKNTANRFNSVIESVPKQYDAKAQISRARALLDSGVSTGAGANAVLATEKAINSVIPGLFDTANAESLKNTYSEMALQAAYKMKGQGQVTENERRMLSDTVATLGNTPKAAAYIMDFMEAVADREIARADYLLAKRKEKGVIEDEDFLEFFKENPLEGKFLKTSAPTKGPAPVIKKITKVGD